jgi:hypothetical protein
VSETRDISLELSRLSYARAVRLGTFESARGFPTREAPSSSMVSIPTTLALGFSKITVQAEVGLHLRLKTPRGGPE